MTTIDEIMSDVQAFASTWALVGGRFDDGGMHNTAEAQSSALRHLITQAIAEARADGAMGAVQRMFPCCGGNDESPAEHCMDCPDRREPVRLTDAEVIREVCLVGMKIQTPDGAKQLCRAIETAVLAANGLTT